MADQTGLVSNPNKSRLVSGSDLNPLALGQQGDTLVSQARGQFATLSVNAGLFIGTTSTAAIAIPINTTTAGSTFGLYNPVGSGVLLELVDFQMNLLAAGPTGVNTVGWSAVNTATNVISALSTSANNIWSGRLGAGVPQGLCFSAVTFTSALTIAANWLRGMFSFPTTFTAGGSGQNFLYVFEGEIILQPGWLVTLTSSVAWAANSAIPSMSWTEYPV